MGNAAHMEHPADRAYYAALDRAERRESAVEQAADEIAEALQRNKRINVLTRSGAVVTVSREDMDEHINAGHMDAVKALLVAGDAAGALALINTTLTAAEDAVANDWAPNRVDYLRSEAP